MSTSIDCFSADIACCPARRRTIEGPRRLLLYLYSASIPVPGAVNIAVAPRRCCSIILRTLVVVSYTRLNFLASTALYQVSISRYARVKCQLKLLSMCSCLHQHLTPDTSIGTSSVGATATTLAGTTDTCCELLQEASPQQCEAVAMKYLLLRYCRLKYKDRLIFILV